MTVLREQHPVGQGGFHSACLSTDENENDFFSYVYDCGSNQREALDRELAGLWRRTMRFKPLGLLVLLAETLSRDGVGELGPFLENPFRWFRDRGVRRVIFALPSDGGGRDPNGLPNDALSPADKHNGQKNVRLDGASPPSDRERRR